MWILHVSREGPLASVKPSGDWSTKWRLNLMRSPETEPASWVTPNSLPTSFILCVCAQLVTCVWLFATPWTIAHQTLLSMVFSRQEYWSGLPFPTPGDLPNPGIKPMSSVSPTLSGRFFTTVPPGKPVASSYLGYNDLLLCSLVVHHVSDYSDWGSKIVSILVGKGQLVCI